MAARHTLQEALGLPGWGNSDVKKDVSEQDDNLEETSDYSPSSGGSEGEDLAGNETFMSKNNVISWSSLPHAVAGRMAVGNVIRVTPGPRY